MATYEFNQGYPTEDAARAALDDAAYQRALAAYRFWYPTVSAEGIFEGNRGAGIEDDVAISFASTGPLQRGFTLNSDTPYGAGVLDLRDGPMAIELPPGPFIGLVDDHHQRWIFDMGIPGPDAGKGGVHVVLPPDYDGAEPEGAFVGRADSFKVLLALRALPVGGDVEKATAGLRSIKVHRLGDESSALGFVETTEVAMESTCLAWEDNLEFWRVLHRVLEEEPVVEEFRPMHGLLEDLGIGKGHEFSPDERMTAILERAARDGRDQMLVSAFASDRPDRIAWPDRKWEWAGLISDNADFETPAGLDLEARDRWFAQAIVASPAMFRRQEGGGSLYWLAARDGDGAYLDGGRNYRLSVPTPVPGKLFWSLTIYDAETRSQVQTDQGKAALRSLFELREVGESAGTVDLFVGPDSSEGAQHRWIETTPGRGWFTYLRIYGPEAPAFDGSWKLEDFVALD
ncbi:MAG TPA: DUF1214 domain-containing protein [Solirubrobacterales bacterium]|jgi:hypothetical protein|nr:DUF1214 domain-containing protein [Solirubrobacterales bacterium]